MNYSIMDPARILVRKEDVLEAEVDGERVVMNGRNYSYFGLHGTGLEIWERIDGSTNLGDLVRKLATEYGADEQQIWDDVTEFVSTLEAAGLIGD
ncbi:MAG: PqqD family protein [Ilumatobacteraceae bacterium]